MPLAGNKWRYKVIYYEMFSVIIHFHESNISGSEVGDVWMNMFRLPAGKELFFQGRHSLIFIKCRGSGWNVKLFTDSYVMCRSRVREQ
jgi:hypothetical protein